MQFKIFFVLPVVCLCLFVSLTDARAARKSIEIDYRHVGLFGAGGISGQYDVIGLKKPLYGVSGQFGYRFNEHTSFYLQTEALYTKAYSSTYLYFPAIAKVKVSIYRDLFFHAGVGYSLMSVSAGNHFARGTTLPAKIYNGFVADGGLAYEWWWEDEYFFSPELGMQFNHIAGDSRASPYLRINVGFAITWFDRI